MNTVFKKDREWIVFFIFSTALIVRLVYIFQILRFPLTEYLAKCFVFDQYWYDQNAVKIMSGGWLGSGVYGKEPFYSYFLALVYKLGGYSHLNAYVIQAILTSLGAVLLYKIGTEIFNKTVGIFSGIIFALYSVSIYHDAILLREGLITFLNIALFFLILKAIRREGIAAWFVAGFTLGLSILTRHNMLLPFILIFILSALRPFKKAMRNSFIFIIGVLIATLPVILRNYIVSDRGYIGISNEVNAFWVGNNYESSGVDLDWTREYGRANDKSGGSIKKTIGVFLEEVKKRPIIYAKLYARKAWMFLNGYEAPSNTNYYLDREEFPTILRYPFFDFRFVCGLGIIGIFLTIRRKYKPYLLYIFLLVLSFSVVLFHIQSRFRLPAAPFFIIFSAYAVYYIYENIKNGRYARPLMVTLIFILFYAVLKPDLGYAGYRKARDAIRPLDRTNLALAYIESYDKHKNTEALDRALRQCDLAVKNERDSAIAYRIKGHLYFLKKNYSLAVREYEKAIIYDNRNPFLYSDLGGIYYMMKDYVNAHLFTARSMHLCPGNKIFEDNLSLITHENY